MEGGGFSPSSGLTLSNIGDYKNVEDIYLIGNGTLFSLFLSVIAARIGNIGGITLNAYFDMFGLEGILSNTMLVILIMQVSRWLYTNFYNSYGRTWSPFVFIAIVLAVQMIHDILFYYGVINILPSGKNEMIDVLKQYAKENKMSAVGGHSVFLIVVCLVCMIMKEMSDLYLLIVPAIVLYMLPYVLSIVAKKPMPVVAPPPSKEKIVPPPEQFMDRRGGMYY
jgi:hypothetical protein